MTIEPIVEPATSSAQLPAKDTFRILILDTVEHTALLKTACKDGGHAVVGAHTIEEAFAFINGKDHADLIVCAAYLEDESLFDFLKRLRTDPLHRHTMFMTLALAPGPIGVKINSSTELAGRAMGSDVFVNMPVFDAVELLTEIRKLLPSVPKLEEEKRQSKQSDLTFLEHLPT